MRTALALAAALCAAACLLPQTPAEPRYFTPRLPDDTRAAAAPGEGPFLRLRRVRAVPYLRQRFVWRRGVEVGFYELWRWTDSPARFAQAALEAELFDRRGLRRAPSPSAPVLEATLESFDECLEPAHEAAVALDVRLVGPKHETLLERTFEARRPIASEEPEAIADALGDALVAAARETGDAVSALLGAESDTRRP